MTSFIQEVVEKIEQVPKVADTLMSGSAVRRFFKRRAALYNIFIEKYTGLQDAKGLIISPEDVTMNRMALARTVRRSSVQGSVPRKAVRGLARRRAAS